LEFYSRVSSYSHVRSLRSEFPDLDQRPGAQSKLRATTELLESDGDLGGDLVQIERALHGADGIVSLEGKARPGI